MKNKRSLMIRHDFSPGIKKLVSLFTKFQSAGPSIYACTYYEVV